MDPLDNLQTTCPILTSWEMSIKQYPNWHLRWIDDPDHVVGDVLVPTQTWTQSSSPELLLTLGMVDHLRGASGKALSLFSLEFSTYCSDTALKECGDGFECGHHMGWFGVVCGRAASTLVLVYMSIRLREIVSEFRSIERFSTGDTTQQLAAFRWLLGRVCRLLPQGLQALRWQLSCQSAGPNRAAGMAACLGRLCLNRIFYWKDSLLPSLRKAQQCAT